MNKKLFIILSVILILITNLVACNDTEEISAPIAKTKFIAHRGLSSQFYENSEAAFLHAAQSDFFWGIETDVWQTSDDIWVCAHDINPFSDNTIKLSDITYAEAAAIPLKEIEENNIADENVYLCKMQRYLEICAEYNKHAVIELKYSADSATIANLLAFTETYIALNNTMFISFKANNINNLLEINENITTQVLVNDILKAALFINNDYNLGMSQNIVSDDIIETYKQNGKLLNVWTVNDQVTAKNYFDKEVDFITTDYIFDFSE